MAATTNGGEFLVFDPAGESTTGFTFDATDPPLLIEAPDRVASPGRLGDAGPPRRRSLRGHDLRGQVVWERPTPWEGWALHRIGRFAVATAADGRALACTGSGELTAQSTSSGESNDAFCGDPAGAPLRLSRRGVHLICSTLDGRVRWRAVADQPPGPLACGAPGVAVMLGKSLAWFRDESSSL